LANDIFSIFNITPGADSLSFYLNNQQKVLFENIPLLPGANFMSYISYYLNQLYFDFISSNFLFGILGSLSILLFYISVSSLSKNSFEKYIIILFVLLPSYSFWSSGISKDVLSTFALSILIYSFVKNNFKLFLISILILTCVRVHLTLIVLISLITTIFFSYFIATIFKKEVFFFNKKVSRVNLIVFILISVIFSFVIIDHYFYENLINLKATINHFQNMYPGKNFIQSEFFLIRLTEYLFKPYLWENTGIYFKILSLENIIIVLILLSLIINLFFHKIKKINIKFIDIKIFILLTFILITIFNVLLTSNAGIAVRQKWTFLPGLIFILIYIRYNLISRKDN
jgi:hypothetical protein